MMIEFSQVGNQLDKFVASSQKAMRLASYRTLSKLAFESKNQIKQDFPKHFPDENGIKKNRGIARLVFYDRNINKSIPNNPSITIFADDKISFMDKQEFKTTLNGGTKGATAAVPFTDSLKKMRRGTKGMKEQFTIKQVLKATKAAMASSLKDGNSGKKKPQPFFMETKSGHAMIAVRAGKSRTPVIPLYHFDRKRIYRPRWDFIKTVDGVVVSMVDKVWAEQLYKALDNQK